MPLNSEYQQIEPKKKRLKQLIKLYYIHRSDKADADESITYFPNYATTINVYQDSRVTWDLYARRHDHVPQATLLKLLVAKFDRARQIIMHGPFNKLTIVFYPLGINHFLSVPLSTIAEEHFSFFHYFGTSFDEALQAVFNTDDLPTKRDILDDFFGRVFCGFSEQRLVDAVNRIFSSAATTTIEQLATHIGVSRKTLLRLFRKHLCISPSEYRSIVRFRNALDLYQKKRYKTSLTALAYEAQYYDQSDLNLHFKELTGQTPRQLFQHIHQIESELYWQVRSS